jgi:hypothetical protein
VTESARYGTGAGCWGEASRGKDLRLERVAVVGGEAFEVEVRFS